MLTTGGLLTPLEYSLAAPVYNKRTTNLGTGEVSYVNPYTQEAAQGPVLQGAGVTYVGNDPTQDTAENRNLFQAFLEQDIGRAVPNMTFQEPLPEFQPQQQQAEAVDTRQLVTGGAVDPATGEQLQAPDGRIQVESVVDDTFGIEGNPVFSPLGDKTPEDRMRFFTNVAQNQYRNNNTTAEQNDRLFGAMLDPNNQWQFTDAQRTRLTNDVTRKLRPEEKGIHNAVGGNKQVRTDSINEWYDSVNGMGAHERYMYFLQNPQWALRHNALAVKLGDKTPEENKQFAATFTNELGIPFDGAGTKNDPNAVIQGSNGRYLVTDFSGRVDNDITKPFSPQDLLAIGTYQAPDERSGVSKAVQAIGSALSPFTMGLSALAAAGLRAAGGETLHGEDYLQTAISAGLGAAFPADTSGLITATQGESGNIIYNLSPRAVEMGLGEAGQELTRQQAQILAAEQVGRQVINAGRFGVGAAAEYGNIEGYDPDNPLKGIGDAQGPGGLYDLVVQDNPNAYEMKDPMEEQGGGGSPESAPEGGGEDSPEGIDDTTQDKTGVPVDSTEVPEYDIPEEITGSKDYQDALENEDVWVYAGSTITNTTTGETREIREGVYKDGTVVNGDGDVLGEPTEEPPTELPPGYIWVRGNDGEWDLQKTGGDGDDSGTGDGTNTGPDGTTTETPQTGEDPNGGGTTVGTSPTTGAGPNDGPDSGPDDGNNKDTNETPITQGLFSGTPYSFDRTDPWKNYSTGPAIRLGQNPLYPSDPSNPTIPRGMLTR